MAQLEEQIFSSPGSVQEEVTKESFRERVMFFESNKATLRATATTPTSKLPRISDNKFSDADGEHQPGNRVGRKDVESEEGNPFASSELESFSESSSLSGEEKNGLNTPSEIIRKFERELTEQKVDEIETKPLEPSVQKAVFWSHPASGGLESGGSRLPSSFEMVNNFRKSESRPDFLKCPFLKPIDRISSKNLYSCNELVFSQTYLASSQSMFRSPGSIVETRPSLYLSNSIITENGICYYIKVSSKTSSWYLLKSLANPELELMSISRNDRELSGFIVSDVVTTLFKRSNYLLFCGLKVTGKFVGQTLCICVGDKCIKTLKPRQVEKKQRTGIAVDGCELELSCEVERDEWFESIKRLNMC